MQFQPVQFEQIWFVDWRALQTGAARRSYCLFALHKDLHKDQGYKGEKENGRLGPRRANAVC